MATVRRTRMDAPRSRASCLLVSSTSDAVPAVIGHGAAIRPTELLRPGLCDAGSGFTSMPAGSISPCLHLATGLCRFSLLFSGSSDCVQFFFVTLCNSCSMGSPRRTPRCLPWTPGHVHSEGCIIWRVSCHLLQRATTFPRPAHPLWPTFLSCVNFLSVFVFFMLDVLAHILIFGSVHHLYASYIYVLCLPATTLFLLHFLLAYFSFLFLCAPLCAIYLEGY